MGPGIRASARVDYFSPDALLPIRGLRVDRLRVDALQAHRTARRNSDAPFAPSTWLERLSERVVVGQQVAAELMSRLNQPGLERAPLSR